MLPSGYDRIDMSSQTGPGEAKRKRSETTRRSLLVVLAVLVTLFAAFNLDEVKVHWVVGSGHAPLIIVIAVSLLVGVVLAYFTERRGRRRR